MNDDQTIWKKQEFLIRALVMCLVDHWTFGGVPRRSLESLGLDENRAAMVIRDLVNHRILEEYITYGDEIIPMEKILEDNHLFREAIVFTGRGKRARHGFELQELIDIWNRVSDKEEKDGTKKEFPGK